VSIRRWPPLGFDRGAEQGDPAGRLPPEKIDGARPGAPSQIPARRSPASIPRTAGGHRSRRPPAALPLGSPARSTHSDDLLLGELSQRSDQREQVGELWGVGVALDRDVAVGGTFSREGAMAESTWAFHTRGHEDTGPKLVHGPARSRNGDITAITLPGSRAGKNRQSPNRSFGLAERSVRYN
jgi:hypothetical protein